MPESSSPPLSRRVQAKVMGIVNIPMRRILKLPFPTPVGKRLMLIYLTGRRTAKQYRQPVSYVRDGTVLLTPGGGKWKLNLREDQDVRIRLNGRDVYARPEIIRDPKVIEPLLEKMIAASPMVNRFVGIPCTPDGRLDPDQLALAVNYGFAIVRWHLDDQSSPST
jgi:hypothetical protein